MANQVDWNLIYYNDFTSKARLTKLESDVLYYHVWTDLSDEAIALKLSVSIATEKRAIRSLKDKYDIVQKFSDILPERRLTEYEKKKKLLKEKVLE